MDQQAAKQRAAEEALKELPESGVIGLGSGSTAKLFIEGVGKLVAQGRKLVGVPTSKQSAELAQALSIPLLSDGGPWEIDVCVDGADEVDARLNLIKGGGGALTREKIVNQHAKTNVIIVDESKLSEILGSRWHVPVEVLAFGAQATAKALETFGSVAIRKRDGEVFRTDSGGFIYDVQCGRISDPEALERALDAIPGVTETGLFVKRASKVIVACADGSIKTLGALARSGVRVRTFDSYGSGACAFLQQRKPPS